MKHRFILVLLRMTNQKILYEVSIHKKARKNALTRSKSFGRVKPLPRFLVAKIRIYPYISKLFNKKIWQMRKIKTKSLLNW